MADPYTYPNGVLRNKFGIRDEDRLQAVERDFSGKRYITLEEEGPSGPFNLERLKATHHFLFQDVYPWAGELRTVELGKPDHVGGEVHWFTAPEALEPRLKSIFARLQADDELRGLPRALFAEKAARYFAQVNNAHPFREGNGRAQRAFFEGLAREAGHPLAFDVVSQERMIEASIQGHKGNTGGFERLFDEISDPERVGYLRTAIAYLEANDFNWNERYLATLAGGRQYDGELVAIGPDSFMMHDGTKILVGATQILRAELSGLPSPGEGLSFQVPSLPDRGRSGGIER